MCCFVALFSTCADLVRHLVNDAWGTICTEIDSDKYPNARIVIQYDGSGGSNKTLPSKFQSYCYSQNVANEFSDTGLFGLSTYGWVFTVFLTYFGFLMLFIGIFWSVSLPQKLMAQWRGIQRNRQRAAGASGDMRAPIAQA